MDNKCVKESFARLAVAVAVVVFGFVSLTFGDELEDGQALVILRSLDFADTQRAIAALEEEGVKPVHIIPPRVVIGFVPTEAEVRVAAIDNVVSIYRSAAPAIGPEEGTDLATGVSSWNHLVLLRGMAPAAIPPGATPLIGDAFEPPLPEVSQSLTGPEVSALPGYYSTSEFMIGRVAVGVILPESNGGSENWSPSRQTTVFNEIVEGLNWWVTRGGSAANLTFYYDQRFSVPTQYEPITFSGWSDENIWVSDIFANMGYTSGDRFARARAYINNIRNSLGTDWSYAFIVVDSLNDSDGKFTSGYFAWAYLGGPYSIMTYDNDGYGISSMNLVATHETGHIFLAADEYCSPGYACCDFGYYGYLNVYNGNCEDGNPSSVPCIMRRNEDAICQWTNGQIGWRDTDSDGKPDTIDNVVNNTLNPYPTPTTETILSFTGIVADVPCESPTRTDVTINRISAVKYRVDGGAWADANARDGTFDDDAELYSFTVGPLGIGQHRIETQAYSTSGNVSAIVGQDVEIQFVYLSTVSDWQHLMNTPADWNKCFILMADLDLQGVTLSPIGNSSQPFTGVFDGNDHIIRNADVNMPGSDNVGLFGYMGPNGQIKNLGAQDITITGRWCVGGLVGVNGGTISNCYSTGPVSGIDECVGGLVGVNVNVGIISNCYSTGSVSSIDGFVGGLVGSNFATISNCYSSGSVSGIDCVGGLMGQNSGGTISNCYSTSSISGIDYVGGLVGRAGGTACTITNSYSTGSVSGNQYVGGLMGENYCGTVTACFWDVNTSGQPTSAGGEGKTTAEMQTKSTFTDAGWDFVNIWDICEGTNYPRFFWQIPAADWLCPDGVGFEDFSYLANGWLMEFGINDLMMLCEQWLEGR